MVKITKKMINKAEDVHFRTESSSSLNRMNALKAVYYKQKGNLKAYNVYRKVTPKRLLDKYLPKKKK